MNFRAVRAIYLFEMARTWRTLLQSIVSPVISTALYFVVFGSAIGSRISEVDGISKSFEGSSLETIKHMVAAGMGVTVVPALSVPKEPQAHLRFVPFAAPVPTRRVVLAWRRTFTRYEAIAALRNAVYACELQGVTRLS